MARNKPSTDVVAIPADSDKGSEGSKGDGRGGMDTEGKSDGEEVMEGENVGGKDVEGDDKSEGQESTSLQKSVGEELGAAVGKEVTSCSMAPSPGKLLAGARLSRTVSMCRV